jgi:maltose O-acetyltransferase
MRTIQRVMDSIRRDLVFAWWSILRNTIAGSVFVPQVLRTVLYRSSGLAIRSFNIREGQVIDNRRLGIGEGTFVNRGCSFEGEGRIDIGADCQIGPETIFITSNHERRADGTIDTRPTYLDIKVGDRAWIGARAVILPGAVVEEDCVIAAGAVVRGRCLAGRTYGGVPARLLTAPVAGDGGAQQSPTRGTARQAVSG